MIQQAAVLVLCLAAAANAQVVSDRLQSVGGGGRSAQVALYVPVNGEPTGMPRRMVWLKEAGIVSISKDQAGKHYLLLDEGGQTYRIRGFPDGTYKASDKIRSLFLVRGTEDPALGGRVSFLWISTNTVTREQLLRHEMSATSALYPLN
jgi:hypothetical protein